MNFWEKLQVEGIKLSRTYPEVLQVNLGRLCNQACSHCHHQAGPDRTETMARDTARAVLNFLDQSSIHKLELTGGSPELNSSFKYLIEGAHSIGRKVAVRSNLTVFLEEKCSHLPDFCASNEVELVCSLPCYLQENVDRQRGEGVYEKSIEALKMLNKIGYGQEEGHLELNLVYNPGGAFLPAPQDQLEADYKRNLADCHGIVFDSLFTLTNMPIGRFGRLLSASSELASYMESLRYNFNAEAAKNVMCRTLISVGWDGSVYDCDFNLALQKGIDPTKRVNILDITAEDLVGMPIAIGDCCYGCTASQGSSCTGALV